MTERTAITPAESAELFPALVNPGAGTAEHAVAALREGGRCRIVEIDPAKLADAVRAEIDSGATRVIVAGGDGTIRAAAAVVAGTPVELGIIPAGTLNHFAKFVGLPEDQVEAARIATGDSVTTVDVGWVNDQIMINTSSVGAYVVFVRKRESYERRFGYRLASLFAAVRVLADLRTFRVVIQVGGVRRVYHTPLVFIGVGEREARIPTVGERVPDGKRGLHVMIVRTRDRFRLILTSVIAALRGLEAVDETPHGIDNFVVDSCRIELRRPRGNVAIDGELVTMIAPLEYRIERDSLRVASAGAEERV
ncbi:MAG: NAD(+)/NADH kinase [Gemmatimonadota bacterium]|nr:NAD(+)/NADH kinase [Gemmatimonadota bacterium]